MQVVFEKSRANAVSSALKLGCNVIEVFPNDDLATLHSQLTRAADQTLVANDLDTWRLESIVVLTDWLKGGEKPAYLMVVWSSPPKRLGVAIARLALLKALGAQSVDLIYPPEEQVDFDTKDAILTRQGESLISTVATARKGPQT